MRTKTILEKSENDKRMEERTCPLPRFSEYNLEVNKMGEIFRDARHYICEILEQKCKELVSEFIIMRGTMSNDEELQKELKQVPKSIMNGDIRSQRFLDDVRDTFGILYSHKLEKTYPKISSVYNGEINEDSREIVHLNNLLVAMEKGHSLSSSLGNFARSMNFMSKDSGGKR